MQRNQQIKISYHRGKGLFYKTVGKGPTGRPRMFWLGSDAVQARVLAQSLVDFWNQFLVPRGEYWHKGTEAQGKQLGRLKFGLAQGVVDFAARRAAELTGSALQPTAAAGVLPQQLAAGRPVPAEARQPTLREAAERHVRTMRAKQLSPKHVARAEAVFKQLYEVVSEHTPLTQLDREKLVEFVEHFLARPKSKLTGKPLAVESVKRVFQYTRALLEEIDGECWDGPKAWRKLFKVRWISLLTPSEQRALAQGKDTFTTGELVDLYRLGTDRQKLYLLLGLNCALGQGEIASLLREDVDLKAGVIDRIRHKTRASAAVRGCWTLWPETVRLLEREVAEPNDFNLALLTRIGRPLVDPESRTDSIKLAWDRVLDKAVSEHKDVRRLSFGTLRKTSATWVKNHGGREVQQLHLCHSDGTVAARHYTGQVDFAPLHRLLDAFRQELTRAGMFTAANADSDGRV